MKYNPTEQQYRCTIVRGKGQTEIEDFLPSYANILRKVCPCEVAAFPTEFNRHLSKIIPMATDKTLSNHRTETAGTLFGMYFEEGGNILISQRTEKLLKDSDLPSFFKDICFKMQFPNGMDSPVTLAEKVEKKICLRPAIFILHAVKEAHDKNNALTRDELGFYALNCLTVLRGKVTPKEVVAKIFSDRKKNSTQSLESGSFHRQHITEIFNYLELANLITVEKNVIYLNSSEQKSIEAFLAADYSKITFNVYDFNLQSPAERNAFYVEWAKYYGELALHQWGLFDTTLEALNKDIKFDGIHSPDALAIGNDGEKFVFEYEKSRIKEINPRWADKVKIVGGTRGLGYDVHSVNGSEPSPTRAAHIEVKSTKRKTMPSVIEDGVVLTRNEWHAAEQYGPDYWIYRVYLTSEGVFIYPIKDVIGKANSEEIFAEATEYRLDFKGVVEDLIKVG